MLVKNVHVVDKVAIWLNILGGPLTLAPENVFTANTSSKIQYQVLLSYGLRIYTSLFLGNKSHPWCS